MTCLRTARAPTSAPLPLLPVPVACLESGSTTLSSARQRPSILGSRAVADKATALGESESGTLPARACAVGAGGPQQGFLSDGASFRRQLRSVLPAHRLVRSTVHSMHRRVHACSKVKPSHFGESSEVVSSHFPLNPPWPLRLRHDRLASKGAAGAKDGASYLPATCLRLHHAASPSRHGQCEEH